MNKKTVRQPASLVPTRGRQEACPTVRYIYWQEDDAWMGYLADYPDYMTQGLSEAELQENLRDIYCDITQGNVPAARRMAELRVS